MNKRNVPKYIKEDNEKQLLEEADEQIIKEAKISAILMAEIEQACDPYSVEDQIVGMRCHQDSLPDFFSNNIRFNF